MASTTVKSPSKQIIDMIQTKMLEVGKSPHIPVQLESSKSVSMDARKIRMMDALYSLDNTIESLLQAAERVSEVIPQHLQWISTLYDPIVISETLDKKFNEQIRCWESTEGKKDLLQSAFEVYKVTPIYDPEYSRFLASVLDPSGSNFVGEIVENVLSSNKTNGKFGLEAFKKEVYSWQEKMNVHLFLMAARHMGTKSMWKSNCDFLEATLQKVNAINTTWEEKMNSIGELCSDTQDVCVPATLQHLQYLLCLKKIDTKPLQVPLEQFLCTCIKKLPQVFPAFLLCPRVSGYTKKTWGFESLKMNMTKKDIEIVSGPFTIVENTELSKYLVLSCNVLLNNIAKYVLGPDVGYFLQLANNVHSLDNDMESNFKFLSGIGLNDVPALNTCIKELRTEFKRHTKGACQDVNAVAVAWKIDLPRKSLICTKVPNNHCLSEPHKLTRKSSAEKTPLPTCGGISFGAYTDEDVQAVRTYVKRTVHANFSKGFPLTGNEIHTMLPESVACWLLHEPALHNIIGLHNSVPWEHEHQDTRYAETQLGNLGSGRYRDWCNFSDKAITNNMFKSKLDSHVLHVSKVYSMQYPWLGVSENKWVKVYSSQPLDVHFLHAPNDDFSVKGLSQSVNNRFKHTLGLLPLRNENCSVKKDDVHMYSDDTTSSVMMVYSANDDTDKNLEFMLFKM